MLQALLTWAESAPSEQAEAVQQLLHHCFDLASSPSREVRLAFAREAPALAQPQLLKVLYGAPGSPSGADSASLEAKRLQVDGQSCCASATFGTLEHDRRVKSDSDACMLMHKDWMRFGDCEAIFWTAFVRSDGFCKAVQHREQSI